jgi:hypothetical protein
MELMEIVYGIIKRLSTANLDDIILLELSIADEMESAMERR